ncbi:MAG: 50S ribosomal protein L10 [Planctomycetota bacterium]|mgnify:CR=1 FL=1
MSKSIKTMMMREYKARVGDARDGMLIGIRGLKAKDQHTLRTNLRKQNIRVSVVRNHLARKALEGSPLSKLSDMLTGSNAYAFGGTSAVEIAREVMKLVAKMPALELKGAVLDGLVFTGKKGVEELSKFPTKDEAIANIVTLVVSPGRTIMGQVKGPGATVGGLIKAIEEKAEKAAPAAEAAPAAAV